MSLRQTWFVGALTILYLCVELAFNARLLDVVGAAASPSQLHAVEVFGRSLSGLALALFVLQWCLGRRHLSDGRWPSWLMTLLMCGTAALAVYVALLVLANHLVDRSSPAFRKASMNIILLQQALVRGDVALGGLNEDPGLFRKPAGKAFLGLFPLMTMSVDKLDEKSRSIKRELIGRAVGQQTGGPASYFEKYADAVKETNRQWQRYRSIPGEGDLDQQIAEHHAAAWGDYLETLGKRGWLPSTVPARYQSAVRKKVRNQVPVSPDWVLTDEDTFRAAVARKVRSRAGDGSAMVDGRRVKAGLSWPAFFEHAAIQGKLRREMLLPPRVRLLPAYASADAFQRGVYEPMVLQQVDQRIALYDAPESSYAEGAANAAAGLDAARAAIVPPLALFCSLMGAILHLCKLCFLVTSLVAHRRPRWRGRTGYLMIPPAVAFAALLLTLSVKNNAVTSSETYDYMRAQMLAAGVADGTNPLATRFLLGSLHIVAVGQDYSYPVNEYIRVRLLNGFDFGYQHEEK